MISQNNNIIEMVLHDEMIDRMGSLADCMSRAYEDGYTEGFKVIGNKLLTDDERSAYETDEVMIEKSYRFDSAATPGDDSIVYLLETRDGKKGTLIDAYGRYADTKLASFVRTVSEHEKLHTVGRERRSWKEFLRGY